MKLEDKLMHLAIRPGQVGEYCILPGDPGRCGAIAERLERAERIAQNREFVTYTGYLDGQRVSVCSTGIGGPSAAIALEELVQAGAHTFIRVGTCGGMARAVQGGDVVVAQSAVRQEGTSREYMPIQYPATADFQVTAALCRAAQSLGYRWHVGVVQSKDSFYGQHEPGRMPVHNQLEQQWRAYCQAGVLASEMEAAALFVVAAVLHVRCGAVLSALWNQERDGDHLTDTAVLSPKRAIDTAVEALRRLIESDRKE